MANFCYVTAAKVFQMFSQESRDGLKEVLGQAGPGHEES
jgi:hypothetical protein